MLLSHGQQKRQKQKEKRRKNTQKKVSFYTHIVKTKQNIKITKDSLLNDSVILDSVISLNIYKSLVKHDEFT